MISIAFLNEGSRYRRGDVGEDPRAEAAVPASSCSICATRTGQ